MSEAPKLWEQVQALKQEVADTEKRLVEIRGKYSVFSTEGRQSIVRECLAVIRPKVEVNLTRMNGMADSLKRLWNADWVDRVREEFRGILETIKDALKKMVDYWAPEDKEVAGRLFSNIESFIRQVR